MQEEKNIPLKKIAAAKKKLADLEIKEIVELGMFSFLGFAIAMFEVLIKEEGKKPNGDSSAFKLFGAIALVCIPLIAYLSRITKAEIQAKQAQIVDSHSKIFESKLELYKSRDILIELDELLKQRNELLIELEKNRNGSVASTVFTALGYMLSFGLYLKARNNTFFILPTLTAGAMSGAIYASSLHTHREKQATEKELQILEDCFEALNAQLPWQKRQKLPKGRKTSPAVKAPSETIPGPKEKKPKPNLPEEKPTPILPPILTPTPTKSVEEKNTEKNTIKNQTQKFPTIKKETKQPVLKKVNNHKAKKWKNSVPAENKLKTKSQPKTLQATTKEPLKQNPKILPAKKNHKLKQSLVESKKYSEYRNAKEENEKYHGSSINNSFEQLKDIYFLQHEQMQDETIRTADLSTELEPARKTDEKNPDKKEEKKLSSTALTVVGPSYANVLHMPLQLPAKNSVDTADSTSSDSERDSSGYDSNKTAPLQPSDSGSERSSNSPTSQDGSNSLPKQPDNKNLPLSLWRPIAKRKRLKKSAFTPSPREIPSKHKEHKVLPRNISLSELNKAKILTLELLDAFSTLGQLKAKLKQFEALKNIKIKIYLTGILFPEISRSLLLGTVLKTEDMDVVIQLPNGVNVEELLEEIPLENHFGFENLSKSDLKPDLKKNRKFHNFVREKKHSFKMDLVVREWDYVPNVDSFDFTNFQWGFNIEKTGEMRIYFPKERYILQSNILNLIFPARLSEPDVRSNVRHLFPRLAKYLIKFAGEATVACYLIDKMGKRVYLSREELADYLKYYFYTLFITRITSLEDKFFYLHHYSGMEKMIKERTFSHPCTKTIITPFCKALLDARVPLQFKSSEDLQKAADTMTTILQHYFEKSPDKAENFGKISDLFWDPAVACDLYQSNDMISNWIDWIDKQSVSFGTDYSTQDSEEEKSIPAERQETVPTSQNLDKDPPTRDGSSPYPHASNPFGSFHVGRTPHQNVAQEAEISLTPQPQPPTYSSPAS